MTTRTWLRHAAALAALAAIAGPARLQAQDPDPTPASRVADVLGPLIGDWRSEERTTPDGRRFRFGYRMEWFDEAHTLARMTITQDFVDGGSTLLWEGFKGWDAQDDGIFYWAASPSGRRAEGAVSLEGTDIVTVYRGFVPDGSVVHIRDIFRVQGDDRLLSVTFIRRDGEWRELTRDGWERTPDPGST